MVNHRKNPMKPTIFSYDNGMVTSQKPAKTPLKNPPEAAQGWTLLACGFGPSDGDACGLLACDVAWCQ